MKNIKELLNYLEKEKIYYKKLMQNYSDLFNNTNNENFRELYHDYHIIFYTYKFLISKIKREFENEK